MIDLSTIPTVNDIVIQTVVSQYHSGITTIAVSHSDPVLI